jgi:hypothetical protein
MRKEDRIRQQQSQTDRESEDRRHPESREQEQMRGGGSTDGPRKPPREPGKLPLPD